jgi:hypothetical protein
MHGESYPVMSDAVTHITVIRPMRGLLGLTHHRPVCTAYVTALPRLWLGVESSQLVFGSGAASSRPDMPMVVFPRADSWAEQSHKV